MDTLQPNGTSLPVTNAISHATPTVYQPLQALENRQHYPPDSAYPVAIRNQDVDVSAPLPYVPQDVVQPSLFVHGAIPKKRMQSGVLKNAAKGVGKKKSAKLPSRHELFTPSDPLAIEDFSDRKQSKSVRGAPTVPQPLAIEEVKHKTTQRVGKRKAIHLTKPRPTFKPKRAKLGMGEKRKNAFNPPKPKRHMQFSKSPNTKFTLWNM
jgi:hypothetical protein